MRIALTILLLLYPLSGHAGERLEKPSLAFCLAAKAVREAAGSDRAAEEVARARGATDATIAKAKRCR